MAYDPKYYGERRQKIEARFLKVKDNFITDCVNLVNRFAQERQNLTVDFTELAKREEEGKKKMAESLGEAKADDPANDPDGPSEQPKK